MPAFGVGGSFRFKWTGRAVLAQLSGATERAAEATGEAAEGYARGIVPVDTGELQRSIGHEVQHSAGAVTVTLFAGAEHAGYVELGTARMPARPYLRPAMDAEGAKFGVRVRQALGGVR